jgi:hypothetical protein
MSGDELLQKMEPTEREQRSENNLREAVTEVKRQPLRFEYLALISKQYFLYMH